MLLGWMTMRDLRRCQKATERDMSLRLEVGVANIKFGEYWI